LKIDLDPKNDEKAYGVGDAKDDYVVLDGEKSIGRIYKEIHGDPRWCWSFRTQRHRRTARIQNTVRRNEADGSEAI
jgi:hypothetical protein